MAKPKIGYQNILESASAITVTSEESSSYAKENAYDWNTYDSWRAGAAGTVYYTIDYGSAIACDYWAMAAHDLSDNNGTVQLQYSSDNFVSDTNDIGDLIAPDSNSPKFHSFTSVSARYWRFEITSTGAASYISQISLGTALTLARAVGAGFGIPNDAHDDEIMNAITEGGNFKGRSVYRRAISSELKLTIQGMTFIRGDWRTFVEHAKLKPFFFAWNPDYDESVYIWMEGNPDKPVIDGNHKTLSTGFRFKGLS